MTRPLGLVVLTACVMLAPPARGADDEGRSVEIAILDVLLARGLIDQPTYDEMLALAEGQLEAERELEAVRERLRRLKADVDVGGGRAGKLSFTSADGTWSMNVKGRLQVRAEKVRGDSGNRSATGVNVSVPRARLGVSGRAGTEGITYKLEIDAPTQKRLGGGSKDFSVKDAYLNLAAGDRADVTFGQFYVPFGREESQFGTTRINAPDSSIATGRFFPGREPGLMASGRTDDHLVEWWAGVFNGEGASTANSDGQDGTSSNGLRKAVRLVVNPMGEVKKDSAAFQTVESGETRVSFGTSFMVNEDQGHDIDGLSPPAGLTEERRSDDTAHGYELQVVSGPVSLLYEHFELERDFDGGLPDDDEDGYVAQVGVFVVPSEVEIVLRKSQIDGDASNLVGLVSESEETALILNLYRDRHASKWSLELADIDNSGPGAGDARRARVQYQQVF